MSTAHWKLLPSRPAGRTAEWFSAWSCKAWLAYILTDLVQGYIQLTRVQPLLSKDDDDNDNIDQQERQIKEKQRHKQWVLLLRNVLFLLPAYHWSRSDWDKRPWLSPRVVNGCMCAEALVSLYQTSLEVPAPPHE